MLILGEAESGKTTLLNRIRDVLLSNKITVALTATDGIAASFLQDGLTIPSFTGIQCGRYTDAELLKRLAGDNDSVVIAKGNMQRTDAPYL